MERTTLRKKHLDREFRTFDPKELSMGKLYDFLVAAIQPRPIAFVSTIDSRYPTAGVTGC